MKIIIDTREKENRHIENELKKRGIEFGHRKLHFGDYSFEQNGKSYENEIVIERKASLDEIASNLTKGRDRFRREFERAHEKKCKVHLMIENGSIEQIQKWDYRSKFTPSSFIASLRTWCYKFQLTLAFVSKSSSCDYILKAFEDYLKSEG